MAANAALSHLDGPSESMMNLAIRATKGKPLASPQAGIINGANPTKYNPSNPILLFIIQVRNVQVSSR
jgi:hypothetical protein